MSDLPKMLLPGDTGFESIKKSLDHIEANISKQKSEVIRRIDNIYVKYSEWPELDGKLLEEVDDVSKEIDGVNGRIMEVVRSDVTHKQIDDLRKQQERCEVAKCCIASLIEIHERLASVDKCESRRNFVQGAFELAHVDALLNNFRGAELLDVIKSLKSNVIEKKGGFMYALREVLEEMLVIKEGKAGLMQTYTVKVHKNKRELQDVFNALVIFKDLHMFLNQFQKCFFLSMCKPILGHITQLRTDGEGDFHTLIIVVKRTVPVKSYKDVFDKLLQVFKFVHEHLNLEISNECKLHSYIGRSVEAELSEMLLAKTLPSPDTNKVDFRQIVNDTRKFQNELVALEIFEEKNAILEYADKMDATLINQKCDQFTVEAITIMKKDLHDMVEVGVHFDSENPLTDDEFPQCSVSKSVIELLEKSEQVLKQAVTDTPASARRTVCAMQNIFYQYGSIVYGHHEKLLQTIPQQVVLYRNNCMYLAHRLSQLNEAYSRQFSETVLPSPPIFKDQPHQLRTIGGDIFLGYVETHIRAMESLLLEHKFESHQLSEKLSNDMDKCFRQCLRQYELLKTVWQKVLPHAVYNKTIGYLVNTFCKKLLATVLEATDINVKNCELLVELYKIVLTRAPKLFTDPEEINLYVEVWQKFNELVFVLTADLAAIEHRWKKGALSTHFQSDEVKHLIRALFQTTDRRAYVLSQIVSVHEF